MRDHQINFHSLHCKFFVINIGKSTMRCTNQHNCPRQKGESVGSKGATKRWTRWGTRSPTSNFRWSEAPVTSRLRRVRRKSSAKIDQSSNQSVQSLTANSQFCCCWSGSIFRTCAVSANRWKSIEIHENQCQHFTAESIFLQKCTTHTKNRMKYEILSTKKKVCSLDLLLHSGLSGL